MVFEGGIEAAQRLRKVVVQAIKDDPVNYSEVMLGWVAVRDVLPHNCQVAYAQPPGGGVYLNDSKARHMGWSDRLAASSLIYVA